MISVNLPENSQDSSQSALELLRPDPPLEQNRAESKKDEGEEDELEALRMAAIASMRPKKSSYKVQAHPVRSNLLSIVPVEDQPESKKPKLFSAVILPNTKRNSESPGKNTTTSKFNRHNDENNESSDLSSSEEEIEVEEEVTATESESEEQSTTKKGDEESSKTTAPSGVVKKQVSIEPDDVLKIDCTDEVDEFTNFLNEFEDDLKSPAVTAEGQAKAAANNTANNKGGPKPKKTKIILVKKKVKKIRNQGSKAAPGARSRSQRSRSPNMRRRSRSPRRRRTPPRGGRYSPYRRSPSPYRRRRYSRSPSPRGRYRPRSRSPRSYRSPPRRPMRRSRSPTSPTRRGGSAPRHMIRSRSGSREKSPTNKKEGDPKQDKSKSLPPSRVDSQNGGKKNSSNKQSAEEKAAHEAEEKLKKLPTPEREKLLQRRKKFEGNVPLKSVAGKKISLKRAAETNVAFDNNGQSVDDTNEDMFDNDTIEDHQPLPAKNRRQANKAPTEPLTKVVTDLRVQLHKKRQQQQKTTKIVEPEIVFEEALPEYESDVDSLENARVTSSDEEEIVHTTISRKKIGITSSGNSSSNRLVTKSGIKGSPRRVGFNQELPTKRTFGQRSVMSRLGAKVSDDSEEENSKKRGKIVISDSGEEDQDDCLTPPETETAISLSKKEKKAEKERKKAEKKKKKEKKKEKKKSKKQRSSSSEPEMPAAANQSAGKGNAVAMAAENSEDDELMNFFENLDSEDILLEKMKKKNDVLNARHKKIEADKKLHS